jgi:hypothetical protein
MFENSNVIARFDHQASITQRAQVDARQGVGQGRNPADVALPRPAQPVGVITPMVGSAKVSVAALTLTTGRSGE